MTNCCQFCFNFAFKFNLRRCIKGWETLQLLYNTMPLCAAFMVVIALFTDVLPDNFLVGRCRLTL